MTDKKDCVLGSGGSFIYGCPKCGGERFRTKEESPSLCWAPCRTPLRLMKIEDLDAIWEPLWLSLGWEIEAELIKSLKERRK